MEDEKRETTRLTFRTMGLSDWLNLIVALPVFLVLSAVVIVAILPIELLHAAVVEMSWKAVVAEFWIGISFIADISPMSFVQFLHDEAEQRRKEREVEEKMFVDDFMKRFKEALEDADDESQRKD